MSRFSKILVPIDFSEVSDRALALACELAAESGGVITALHAYEPIPLINAGLGPPEALTPQWMALEERLRSDQARLLERMADRIVPEGVNVRLEMRSGYPPDVILAEIQEGGHDLVVMGTHGRTGLERVLLGSTAERVLRRSPAPVLTVR